MVPWAVAVSPPGGPPAPRGNHYYGDKMKTLHRPILLILLGVFLILGAGAAADTTAADVTTSAALTDAAADAPEAAVAAAAIADALSDAPPAAGPGAAIEALTNAAASGAPLPIVSALIFLLLSLLRLPAVRGAVTKILPMRWVSVLAVALGVLWSVLDQAATLGWWPAIVSGLFTGGGAVALHEVLIRAVGGKDAKEHKALEGAYAAAMERGDLAPLRALADPKSKPAASGGDK